LLIFTTYYTYTEWRSVTVIETIRDMSDFYNGVGLKRAKEGAIKMYVA